MAKGSGAKNKAKKDYPPSIGFWTAKSGNGFTKTVNEEVMGILGNIQPGCTLYLQEVTDARSDRAPQFRVTVFPPFEQREEQGI